MAEARESRTERIFRSTLPRENDDQKAHANSRKRERHLRHFSRAVSEGLQKVNSKVRQMIHAKPQQTRPKEEQKQAQVAYKKPPFIVGKVRHNDLHLIQAINPAQQPKTTAGCVKKLPPAPRPAAAPVNKQSTVSDKIAVTKNVPVKSAALMAPKKPLTNLPIAPESQTFTPPKVVKIICQNCSSTPNDLSKMEFKLNQQSARNQFTPRRDDENPYITRNRQFSEQKPFSKLVASHGFPAPLIQSFSEDESEPKSWSDQDNPSGNPPSSKSTPDGKELENDSVMSRNQQANEKSFKTSSQHLRIEEVEVLAGKTSSGNETLAEDATSSDADLMKRSPLRKEMAQELRDRTEQTSFHLEELCCRWNAILEEEGGVPPDETGTVLTVIGQTQQLLKDRFVQYSNLIDQFENNSGIKKIEKEDLEGFWEMILLQVIDVEKKFADLDIFKKHGWVRPDISGASLERKASLKLKRSKSVKSDGVKPTSGIRSHIAAMRKMINDPTTPKFSDGGIQTELLNKESHQDSGCISSIQLNDLSNEGGDERFFNSPSTKESVYQSPDPSNKPKEKPDTPFCRKVMNHIRKKHNSAKLTSYFSPLTSSPRQRSHSSDNALLKDSNLQGSPKVSKSPWKFGQFLRLPSQTPKQDSAKSDSDMDGRQLESPSFPTDSPAPRKEENNNEMCETTPVKITVLDCD